MALSIPLPNAAELGPAMKALDDRQRTFVIAMVVMGNAVAAAQAAGHSGSGLAVTATRLKQDARIRAAIAEEQHRAHTLTWIPPNPDEWRECPECGTRYKTAHVSICPTCTLRKIAPSHV